jgi:GntP family gluconate:H+ symporter
MILVIALVAAILFIVIATTKLQMHPFLALILAAFGYGLTAGMEPAAVVDAVNKGFGGTIGYIGIVIIAGTIIGVFLEKSGGARSLAESVLKITGKKNVPGAMGLVGYVVSMPVFCDSGFVLLAPLNKALCKRAGISIAGGAVALALGLYVTHTMVPPTPGPVAAAGILGAELGTVILWGMLVSLVSLVAGWLFAILYAARFQLDETEDKADQAAAQTAGGDTGSTYQPATIKAVLPIVLPIVLIVLQSIAKYPGQPLGTGIFSQWIIFFGQPVVALLIGAGLAMLLPEKFDLKLLSGDGWVGEAILAAAGIIIITGGGGAFGKVLQESGIADTLGAWLSGTNVGIWLPFVLAAAIKTAQGSSTVAIITTAGIIAPLLASLQLDAPTARALTVIAIGAGAMVVSHANDSFFWVVTQFSGMNLKMGYRLHTMGTLIVGLSAAVSVWGLSLVLL